MSSAFGLVTLIFFSVTGITLNHPEWFSSARSVDVASIDVENTWMTAFGHADERDQMHMLTQRVNSQWGLGVPQTIDRDDLEWMLDYPRPGGVSVVVLDLEQRRLTHERVDDGVVSLINDLHKGRHAGLEWRLLVDAVAVVCLLFAFTGIILLVAHATKRRSTWPLVLLGALAPLGCYGLFVP